MFSYCPKSCRKIWTRINSRLEIFKVQSLTNVLINFAAKNWKVLWSEGNNFRHSAGNNQANSDIFHLFTSRTPSNSTFARVVPGETKALKWCLKENFSSFFQSLKKLFAYNRHMNWVDHRGSGRCKHMLTVHNNTGLSCHKHNTSNEEKRIPNSLKTFALFSSCEARINSICLSNKWFLATGIRRRSRKVSSTILLWLNEISARQVCKLFFSILTDKEKIYANFLVSVSVLQ